MPNNRSKTRDTGGGNPGNLTGEGSGQQTAGKRGQKMDLEKKVHYRNSQQNKKSGTRGGNR